MKSKKKKLTQQVLMGWPKKDPITGRFVCQRCWDQEHKKCWNKNKDITMRIDCRCACHDGGLQRPRLEPLPKSDQTIMEIYGEVTI